MKRFNFRTESGRKHLDIVSHAEKMIQKHPDLTIYVGCDSQNSKRSTFYAVVVAFRYGTRGAHFIFHKEKVRKIKDRWTRLWKEAEMTAEVAQYLRKNLIPVHVVELDYNKGDRFSGSYNMVSAGVGYLRGLGFDEVTTKPDEQVAVKAANHIVN